MNTAPHRSPTVAILLAIASSTAITLSVPASESSSSSKSNPSSPPLQQSDTRADRLERELEELRRRLGEVERELRDERSGRTPDGEPEERPDGPAEGPVVEFTPVWSRETLERPAALRGVYDKPFLMSIWRRAHIGGYTELEYHSFEDGILGIPEGFRMHRTNLFLFTEISDRVQFGSEIEFETEFEGTGVSDEIEVALEMAFIDWVIFEELVIRGGALLPPLGRINVNHDGPVRELTERPLVSTFVIPTTLTEAGVGARGTIAVGEDVSLGYEAYAVNGFNVLDSNGNLSAPITDIEQVLREGRTSIGGDINGGVAGTGRISLGLADRLEIGGSWHVGTYDEEGDNLLRIFAGDMAIVQPVSWFEIALEGEVAVSDFERNSFARTAGVPDRFWGFYVQGSIGGMPPALRDLVPHVFDDEGARFTIVFRWDHVDLDGDTGDVLEPGINFRPVADTVFKLSWRLTQKSIGLRDLPGREDFDDDGLVFSISTYF